MSLPKADAKVLVLIRVGTYGVVMKLPHTKIDIETVSTIIAQTAAEQVMPRFQALAEHDIRKKSRGELVTIADIETETELARQFLELLPCSAILGEESIEKDPDLMKLTGSNGPVWIIDPIDGTNNFASGKACFAVMVAFLNHGQVQACWIYNPIEGVMCHALRGGGVWCEDQQLGVQKAGQPIEDLCGTLSKRLVKRYDEIHQAGHTPLPRIVPHYRCCGREYMNLALGELDFVQFSFHLKPWDHAPGSLIGEELGCFQGFLPDAASYDATQGMSDGYLMIAPDKPSWHSLRTLLWDE